MYFLRIRSRNFSTRPLTKTITSAHRGVYRAGSTTPLSTIFTNAELDKGVIEINTVDGCEISGNKIKMKKAFVEKGVTTANYIQLPPKMDSVDRWIDTVHEKMNDADVTFPVIIKHKHSSRGIGIYYCADSEALQTFLDELPERRQQLEDYICEHYYTYTREYRLHVDQFGCFLAHRKMLRNEAEIRWHRHHENCVWINSDNPQFEQPSNWDSIVAAAQAARKAVGLDICSVDIKVQSSNVESPKFIILETNSASALGEATVEIYKNELQKIADAKNNSLFAMDSLTDDDKRNIELVQSVCPKDFSMCVHFQKEGLTYGICNLKEIQDYIDVENLCDYVPLGENLPVSRVGQHDDDDNDEDDEDEFDDYDDDTESAWD